MLSALLSGNITGNFNVSIYNFLCLKTIIIIMYCIFKITELAIRKERDN